MGDNKRGQRATLEQLEVILEAVERKPSLQVLRQTFGVETVDVHEWDELVAKLNAIGPKKTVAKWQKTWRDYRLKTKKKAAKLLEEQNEDDGSSFQALTDMEVRILNLDEPNSNLKIIKPAEINITNIPELDPLSSEESGDEPLVVAPNLVTVYDLRDADRDVKTEQANNRDNTHRNREIKSEKDPIKRRRIEFRPYFNSDQLCKNTSEILEKLISINESRNRRDENTRALLERMCVAMETQGQAINSLVLAVEKQTGALNTFVDCIQRKSNNIRET